MANKRPPWKIPDVIDPPERRCIQIQIPDDPQHIAIFWGVLRSLSDWQRWERESTHSASLVAQVWRKVVYAIDWSNMSCCPEPTNQYYDADGVLQVSYDGGATYEPDTTDPRLNSPLLPALPGENGIDKRCTASNNVTGYIKAMADQLIADGSAWNNITTLLAALGAIIVLLLSIGTAGALTPLLLGLVAALLGTGLAAFEAAMTEAVYSDLNCIIYCHTPNDAVYTVEDWQAIKAEILTTFTGIVSKFIYDNINAMGLAGMTNASRAGVHAGEPCNECSCNDCVNFNIFAGTLVSQTGQTLVVDSVYEAANNRYIVQLDNYPAQGGDGTCCFVSGLDFGGASPTQYTYQCNGSQGFYTPEGLTVVAMHFFNATAFTVTVVFG